VLSVALAGDLPIRELTKIAKDEVKQRIQQVPGVGTVDLIGGREREIKVLVDPARMTGFGLTVDDVTGAIQAGNIELPAGYIKPAAASSPSRPRARSSPPPRSARSSSAAVGGASIRVKDVAEVVDDVEEARSASFLNGKPALSLVVRKQSGANVVALAARHPRELALLGPELEARRHRLDPLRQLGVRRARHRRRQVRPDHRRRPHRPDHPPLPPRPARDLHRRPGDPHLVVATFAFMSYMGFSFNNISMLALSLSIGILVDDAIVVIENIYRHLEMGKPRMRAALDATSEIGLAVIATTLSIVAVFVPVAYMDGHHRPLLLPVRPHRLGRRPAVDARQLHPDADARPPA
jgi:HAE1 family hydrophobic/amphiphilic exporter-1